MGQTFSKTLFNWRGIDVYIPLTMTSGPIRFYLAFNTIAPALRTAAEAGRQLQDGVRNLAQPYPNRTK